jgi:uncharacterized oxidoreductase
MDGWPLAELALPSARIVRYHVRVRTHGLRVLVTGGGSGIGLATARRLAVDNQVVIAGRDRDRLEAAVVQNPSLRMQVLDVSDEIQAGQAIDGVVNELGGLDLLINAAGVIEAYGIDSPKAERAAERDVQINLLGSIRMVRLALPYLRRQQGAGIVLFSSVVAIAPAPGYAVYSATKAAVHSLARSLRRELAGELAVFDVLPTWVDTGQARNLDVPKLGAQVVADAIVKALERNRTEILVGQAPIVSLVNRLAPGLADRLVARATQPSRPGSGR